jgi:MoaA/NifB/PqqE/SkfB family radical SAM enzyme
MATSKEVCLFRKEWFGGFQYNWSDNCVTELNQFEFQASILNENVQAVLLQPPFNQYIPYPIRVALDLSYFCNQKCIYCHSNSGVLGQESLQNELLASDICNILSDCEKMGVFEVTLTGGEPLLKEDIFNILDYAGNLKNVFTHLITNGTLIDESIAKRIKTSNIKKVSVSIDGFEKTMEKHRWSGAYNQSMSALQNLIAEDVNVGVISVITKHNYNEFEQFVDMLYKLGVRCHNTSSIANIGRATRNWLGLNKEELFAFSSKMIAIMSRMQENGYNLTFNNAVLSFGEKKQTLPTYIFEDAVPGCKCVVKPNGDVIYDRIWGREIHMGTIREKSLYDIWIDSHHERLDYLKENTYQKRENKRLPAMYYRFKVDDINIWHWLSDLSLYSS